MKYILLLLCLILSATIFYQFKYYSNNEYQMDSDAIVNVDESSLLTANKTLKSINAYSAIIKRPLFSKDRKPPVISATGAVDSIDIGELEGLTLYGVVISSNDRYAIVASNAKDNAEHIKVGRVYKGWQVSEINADSVKFESEKGQYELFITPNDSTKKSGIIKSYRNGDASNKSSNKSAARPVIYRSARKPGQSPIEIPVNRSEQNKSQTVLNKKELDELLKLGDEGGYEYDPDEGLGEEN